MAHDSVETRMNNVIPSLNRICYAYNEGLRLQKLYGDVGSKNVEIHDCIKVCQTELSSVIDIGLRCFCIVKKIPVYIRQGNNYKDKIIDDSDEGDSIKAYASNYCCSISTYNLSVSDEKRVLTDVDLECFLEDRDSGNLPKHLGIVTDLKRVYRCYHNIYKVIQSIGIKLESELPSINVLENNFEFEKFNAWMSEIDASQRRYVLISKSLHDIPEEQMECLVRLPWSLILDYDAVSNIGGLKHYFDKFIEVKSYDYNILTGPNFNITTDGKPLYLSLFDGDSKENITSYGGYVPSDGMVIANIRKALAVSMYPNLTVVLIGSYDNRMMVIYQELAKDFSGTDIIFLTPQSKEEMRYCVPTKVSGVKGAIDNVFIGNAEIFDVMQSLYNYRDSLPELELKIPSDLRYEVKLISGTKVSIPNQNVEQIERYFEILHLGVGTDALECDEISFLHGKEANWATIANGCIKPLVTVSKFESAILNDPDLCYYIYHLPGFGGTTLGRQIAWDLHKILPVFVLKKYIGSAHFSTLIAYIYKILDNSRFLILVDEDLFSPKDIIEIASKIKNNEYGVRALFVQRENESNIISMLRCGWKNIKTLSALGDQKDYLIARCHSILEATNQGDKFDERKYNLDNTLDKKQQCPLLINLYLLEDFTLTKYVSKFLESLDENDTDAYKLRRAIALIAICYYYGNLTFPMAYLSNYLSLPRKSDKTTRYVLSSVKELFFEKRDGNGTHLGIKHYMIAEELIKQLLFKEGLFDWHIQLPGYIYDLIELLYSTINNSKLDEIVSKMVTTLFTDKRRGRIIDGYSRSQIEFTSLIDSVDNLHRSDVLELLVKRFSEYTESNVPYGEKRDEYNLLAHIYAQSARVRAKCPKLDDDWKTQIKAVQEYCSKAKKIIEDEGLIKDTLEHILGMCLIDRVEIYRENLSIKDEEHLKELITLVDEAIEHFENATIYGSPDYGVPQKINAINTAIRMLKDFHNISSEVTIKTLKGYPDIEKYIILGSETIENIEKIKDIDEKNLTKALTLAYRYQEEFNQLCFGNNASSALSDLDDLLKQLSIDDYSGQYTVRSSIVHNIQRKHYDKHTKNCNLLIKVYNRDSKAINDAKKIIEQLDILIQMEGRPASTGIFNMWFEYAKLFNVSLNRALQVAIMWKTVEISRKSDVITPYYYLFVITLLLHMDGMASSADVLKRKVDLNRVLPRVRYISSVQDWYALGNGMGKLISRSVCRYEDVVSNDKIPVISGKIAGIEDKRGYILIDEPKGFSNWEKPVSGMTYARECCAFYNTITSALGYEEGHSVKFKIGFSYEKFIASDNSLFELNVQKVEVVENKKAIIRDFKAQSCYKKDNKIILLIGDVDGEEAALHYTSVFDNRDASDEEMINLYKFACSGTIKVRIEKKEGKLKAYLNKTGQDIQAILSLAKDIQEELICDDSKLGLIINDTFTRDKIQKSPKHSGMQLSIGTIFCGIIKRKTLDDSPMNKKRLRVEIVSSGGDGVFVVSVDYNKITGKIIKREALNRIVNCEVPVRIISKLKNGVYCGNICDVLE